MQVLTRGRELEHGSTSFRNPSVRVQVGDVRKMTLTCHMCCGGGSGGRPSAHSYAANVHPSNLQAFSEVGPERRMRQGEASTACAASTTTDIEWLYSWCWGRCEGWRTALCAMVPGLVLVFVRVHVCVSVRVLVRGRRVLHHDRADAAVGHGIFVDVEGVRKSFVGVVVLSRLSLLSLPHLFFLLLHEERPDVHGLSRVWHGHRHGELDPPGRGGCSRRSWRRVRGVCGARGAAPEAREDARDALCG